MQRLHLRCEAGGVQGVLVARHMSARCHMRVWGRYSAPLSRLCAARVRGGAGAACGDGVWHRHYTMYPDLVRHHNSEQKRARKAQRIRHPTTADQHKMGAEATHAFTCKWADGRLLRCYCCACARVVGR